MKRAPKLLSEAIKEVEKLQAAQQITSSLLPTSSVNTISSDNDRMIGISNAKTLVIWLAIAHTYGATTVIITDM